MSLIFTGQTRRDVPKETFDNNYERIFGKKDKIMHKNEIVITKDNKDELTLEAMELGSAHVKALEEQIARQEATSDAVAAQEPSS